MTRNTFRILEYAGIVAFYTCPSLPKAARFVDQAMPAYAFKPGQTLIAINVDLPMKQEVFYEKLLLQLSALLSVHCSPGMGAQG